MISRFFIDRPIFASVLSILITLTGTIALRALPIAQYPRITPPGVSVSIRYPGANAQVVSDTVAAPIEQQVNGVPGMLYMSSQCGNDGSYTLTVTFDLDVDLNTALVMVQNRVALAMPQLPNDVQKQGITIKKKTPDILLVVNFFSPSAVKTSRRRPGRSDNRRRRRASPSNFRSIRWGGSACRSSSVTSSSRSERGRRPAAINLVPSSYRSR
jgi:multidrug efflux pump subunit AcrB